ncbi:aminotransferase class V-fold PLP-dependent enzyme [Algoriphagus halophytocola]|uniref:Aminotransferase class V-fold PLP-dependent enzyme n=1 Tax=Algoriphagus halophytocola TaxID=2991499 RepID=A0ABY6MF31_9BACT|nr:MULTISPECIES: aminotransferase class V-fold PLP-dependent enzyme [unclassified Algoriphagus]UZD22422.1 aminotransferase class V-fold PLP-dependent enzyme [Algoriphagus sp. TR-M5]WBL43682.1 aminotransferase class V-fold PLP-dependent enzyme [Algoriphagus sp. TR-M9]
MDCQKHLFNLDPDIHYLNCAYKAPLLKKAEEAGIKAIQLERNPVNIKPSDFFTGVKEVKSRFAKLIASDPLQVAVIPSTSYGFATALNNISAEPGMKAITVGDEFPSGYLSLRRWCDRHSAKLEVIKPGADMRSMGTDWNQRILDSIDGLTTVVLLSSVHWMNGVQFDLESIGQKCRTVGAKFIVDGTQSVGAFPMDVKKFKIDALICATYKWLFGPYGLGMAFYGDAFDNGIPLEESWMNRTNSQNFGDLTNYDPEYTEEAGRYNVGEMSNFILMPMLNQALIQLNEWTVSEISEYCRDLTRPLFEYFESVGVEVVEAKFRSHHLFGIRLPEEVDADLLKVNLEASGVYLSFRGDLIRIAVNVFNTEEDISSLIQVFERSRSPG